MEVNVSAYRDIKKYLDEQKVQLIAVSKTKPVSDILDLYNLGQRDFGENYVQELVDKATQLPKDIRWHFIGHLQTNKVKQITPFVQLIHGVDSLKLLKEINKQGGKAGRVIDCLLQVHIAQEETKFGLDEEELKLTLGEVKNSTMNNVRVCGLMGMASFSDDMDNNEFRVTYSNIGYGIYPAKFSLQGGKPVAVEIKSNDFVESDAYLFVKDPEGLIIR